MRPTDKQEPAVYRGLTLLEGELSVRAALEGKKRVIKTVFVDKYKKEKRDRKILALLSCLKQNHVPTVLAEREKIDALVHEYAGEHAGHTHGGVIAFASERTCSTLSELLETAGDGDYFVCLDGIEDPFNLGYAVRVLYAMGCKGFLLPKRDWTSAAGVLARASAGASERCDMAILPEDGQTVEEIRSHGVKIVCSALAKNSQPLAAFSPRAPFVLFIGGEKRGISPCFMEAADAIVHIPYVREEVRYSLPTATVCAMFAEKLAERGGIPKRQEKTPETSL